MSVPHAKVVKAVIAIDNGQDNSIAAAQRRFREEHPHETKLSRGQQQFEEESEESVPAQTEFAQRIFYCGNYIRKSSAPTAAYCRN